MVATRGNLVVQTSCTVKRAVLSREWKGNRESEQWEVVYSRFYKSHLPSLNRHWRPHESAVIIFARHS